MSETEDRYARPYLRALNEQASDLMAETGIPQQFWPAQIIEPRPAIESAAEDETDG